MHKNHGWPVHYIDVPRCQLPAAATIAPAAAGCHEDAESGSENVDDGDHGQSAPRADWMMHLILE